MNIICEDKSKLNYHKVLEKLNIWKNINYGFLGAEFQYIYVKRKIFVEKFLSKMHGKITDCLYICPNIQHKKRY